MNGFDTLVDNLNMSLNMLWPGVAMIITKVIIAVILIAIAWIIGAALSKIIEQIFKSVKVDKALSGAGVDDLVKRAGMQLNSGRFVGELVKWFTLVVFLIAVFDFLNLYQVTAFLTSVAVSILPKIIVSVLILVVAVVVGEFAKKTVIASAKAASINSASFLGNVTKWIIWIFAIITVLLELNIGSILIQTVLTGLMIAVSLAVGLSFGLGGQDAAKDYIAKLKSEMKD